MNSPSNQDLGAALDAAIHELRGPTHALSLILHLMEREDQKERPRDPDLVPRARRILSRLSQLIDNMEEIARRFTQTEPPPARQPEAEEGPAPISSR